MHIASYCAYGLFFRFRSLWNISKNARKLGVGHGQFDAGVNGLNMERTYKWKLCGSARQSENGILCFDWLIHPGVSYSREIWIFSEREGSFKAFYGIQPRVFHFLFNVIIQAKSHFAIFQVLLFPISLHWIWNSLRNNSVLHFVCTIITLINLNNFKYPTKIHLCS